MCSTDPVDDLIDFASTRADRLSRGRDMLVKPNFGRVPFAIRGRVTPPFRTPSTILPSASSLNAQSRMAFSNAA